MSPESFSSSESALGRKPQRRAGQSRGEGHDVLPAPAKPSLHHHRC
uniref:Uncharacterized protein n=1 Tax=Anguilla anguilla TaxID=7936 RepID=A0A0E9R075_ANGAN